MVVCYSAHIFVRFCCYYVIQLLKVTRGAEDRNKVSAIARKEKHIALDLQPAQSPTEIRKLHIKYYENQ